MALWNVLVCLVISLACWSFLLSSRSEGPMAIFINVGLLLAAVGTFVSAFAVLPGWWALLARTGAALVAGALYEQRFGSRAQLRALIEHFAGCPARWRAVLQRLRQPQRVVRP